MGDNALFEYGILWEIMALQYIEDGGFHSPPIYWGVGLSLMLIISLSLTYPLVGISPPCFSTSRTRCLGEALPNFLLLHHHCGVVLLEVPEDPLLPLPTGARGRRSSSIRTCDRVRRRRPFVAPSLQVAKFFATLRSDENTLHRPRLFAGTFFPLPVFEGEFSQNRCDLSPRFDPVFVATVGNFLFSMQRTHQWYQSQIYA
jgi:hypothetical protein